MSRRLWVLPVALLATPLLLAAREPDDSLRTTLAVLPPLLAGVYLFERWAEGAGARRRSDRESTLLGITLVALVLLALAWRGLGLAVADSVIAAGFLLLLLYWAGRTLLRLRPLLDLQPSSKTPTAFFWLPLLVYLALIPWTAGHRAPDGDEPYNLLIAHSLAYDGDGDLTNNYRQQDWRRFLDREIRPQVGDPRGPRGEIYSRHNFLLPLVLAAPYRAGGKLGALATMAVLSATLVWLTLRLARRYFPRSKGEVLYAYAILAFCPPLLLYSSQIWVEVPAALLVVLGLDGIRSLGQDTSGRNRTSPLRVALPILVLPLIKIRLMLLSGSLLLLLWTRRRRSLRATVLVTLLLVIIGCGILLHNQLRFDNPLKVHSLDELNLTRQPLQRYLQGLGGLFFDGAFGLFSCAPIWLLLLPAVFLLAKRRHRLLVDLAVIAIPYLAFVAPRSEWYGGWSPPFRYGLAFLPLLTLTLVPLLAHRDRTGARLCASSLGALTLVLTVLWIVQPGWAYNWANGTSRIFEHLGSQLGADFGRLFPSYIRIRPASWWWPPIALALSALWWLPPRGARWAAPLGSALLLVASSGMGWLATHLPTRHVEVEDAFVEKSGGRPFPALWVVDRPRHRGGWVLPEGSVAVVPVAAGGKEVSLEIEARLIRRGGSPGAFVVRAGSRDLFEQAFDATTDWQTFHLGPFAWTAGDPLVLEARGPRRGGQQRHRVVADKVRLQWR